MSSAVLDASIENLHGSRPDKMINLDLGEQRRHSFLPESWNADKEDANVKNLGVVEINEDDDLFMYMQASNLYKEKPLEKFCTGGRYLGQWNRLGMAGKGVYKYPHGVVYDGYFNRNGEFHGTGILVYPNGHRIEGVWKNGKLGPDTHYIAKGGIIMSKNYCIMPDRRFQIEVENDLNPVGQEYETDEVPPPREIPAGCFDMENGFYDPVIKSVCKYTDDSTTLGETNETEEKSSSKYLFSGDESRRDAFDKVLESSDSEISLLELLQEVSYKSNKIISWIPSLVQEEWIVKNCRKAWEDPVGYRPDLYEEWTKGGKTCTGPTDEEIEQYDNSIKVLNLDKEVTPSPSRRLPTFIINKPLHPDAATIDMLSNMFTKSTTKSNTDMQQLFTSEELILPRGSTQ